MSEETMPHHCDTEFMKPSEETLTGPALRRKIAEVREKRPDDWWEEFNFSIDDGESWNWHVDAKDFWDSVGDENIVIRHRPPKVKLSGEVEPEVLRWLRCVESAMGFDEDAVNAAKALLSCVQKEEE